MDNPTPPEAMAAAKRIITRADPYMDRDRAAKIIGEEFAAVRGDLLEIATKLYARALGVSLEEATDNINDAYLNRKEPPCPT